MKKLSKLLLAVVATVAVSTAFTGCLSTSKLPELNSAELTEENSALVYIHTPYYSYQEYNQLDSTKKPNHFVIKQGGLVPTRYHDYVMECDSFYRMSYYQHKVGNTIYYANYPVNGSKYEFAIPKQPGVYFIDISMEDDLNGLFGRKDEEKYHKKSLESRLDVLKNLKRSYRKTHWEPLIEKEMVKVQAELDGYKK